jgi:hypothetical protein
MGWLGEGLTERVIFAQRPEEAYGRNKTGVQATVFQVKRTGLERAWTLAWAWPV